MEKKLYFKLSDSGDVGNVVLALDGCMEWIKNDTDNYNHEIMEEKDFPEYTLVPVWMTEEEFDNLPEAEY
jgi:hypothetical protein